MFDLELQRRIREKKTPLALTLAPEAEKLNGKVVKNFIDMFGDTPMAQAEALRYHGTTLLDAAADEKAREALGLDERGRVLLISTEGDTDPVNYRRVMEED